MYESVKKWTSKVDIFDRKYIFIPINESMHWYLMMIYNPAAYLVKEDEGKTSNDILDSVNTDVAMDSVDVDSHIDSNNEVNEIKVNGDPATDELSTVNEHTNSYKEKYDDNEDEISLINAVNEMMSESIDNGFNDIDMMLLKNDAMIIDDNCNDNNENNNDNNNNISIIADISNNNINNNTDINTINNDNNNNNNNTNRISNDNNNNSNNFIDIDSNKNNNDNNNNIIINSNINSIINDDNNKKNKNIDYNNNDNSNGNNNNGNNDKNDDSNNNDNNVIIININDNNNNNNKDNDDDNNKNSFDNPIKIESDTSSLIEFNKVLDNQIKSSIEKINIKEDEITKNEISLVESINEDTNENRTNKLSKSNNSNSILDISSCDIKEINEKPQIEIDDKVQLGTKLRKNESKVIPISNKNNKLKKQTKNEVINGNNTDTEEKKENPNIKVLLSDAHSLKIALDEKNLDNSNCILERFKQLIIRELALKMINFLVRNYLINIII